ncbi:hypothetical protein SAMN05661096_03124 [Marivirga sericea]|uniref:DUF4595 domain-containing protein n=1 Tax=Marivirga sericea TaxID=1028 RepID=A0A1X7KUY6_9BACT|nr:hypothetical protein [Marivirga sericea]SMG45283.1 hypothetical protein SAMN05661096_03124 [Marivirga sericea]
MKYHILTILLLFVSSCSQQNNEDKELESESEIAFSDEIKKAIIIADNYKPLIINSTFSFTDSSGNKYNFKRTNGKLDSTFTVNYSSGKLKIMLNYDKGKLIFGQHGLYYDDTIDYSFITEVDTFIMEDHPMYKIYYHTNLEGELTYFRKYDQKGDPADSDGKLIAFSKYSTDKDSVYFQFYLVREPYQPPRVFDLERTFFLTITDTEIQNVELPINLKYSAVFYNASLSALRNKSLIGLTTFSDYTYGADTIFYSTDSVIYEF